jgi:predicted acylesterase/phospholipase RssA
MTLNNPWYSPAPQNEIRRLYSDLYLLGLTLWAPMMITPYSPSVSRLYADSLDYVIDFENIKNVARDVYINALDISSKKVALFDKNQITRQHLVAGSSLYFLTPQQEIDGRWYAEGSYVDCLNYRGLLEKHADIQTIVVMNILNKEDLIRRPHNLYDAYNLSVMLPFITIAEDDTKLFEAKHKGHRNLLKLGFDIPFEYTAKAMDWNVSNFRRLREIGYDAGLRFYERYRDDLV